MAETVEEFARHYVSVLNGPANGWGQHIDPKTGGQSHFTHITGTTRYGEKEFNSAVDAAFKEARDDLRRHRST